MKAATKQQDDGIDIYAGFKHVVRPAAGLEPVRTEAPNSVFGLAGGAPLEPDPASPPKRRKTRLPPLQGAALETIRTRGPMTTHLFSVAMNLTSRQASFLLRNMKVAGKVVGVCDDDNVFRYSVPGALPTKSQEPMTSSARDEAPVQPPAVLDTPVEPELSCAIFNTGAMLIEVPDSPPLRLTPRHATQLIDYLRTLQGGLK